MFCRTHKAKFWHWNQQESVEAAESSKIHPNFSRPPKNPKIILEHPEDLRKRWKKGEAEIQSGGQPKMQEFQKEAAAG